MIEYIPTIEVTLKLLSGYNFNQRAIEYFKNRDNTIIDAIIHEYGVKLYFETEENLTFFKLKWL